MIQGVLLGFNVPGIQTTVNDGGWIMDVGPQKFIARGVKFPCLMERLCPCSGKVTQAPDGPCRPQDKLNHYSGLKRLKTFI